MYCYSFGKSTTNINQSKFRITKNVFFPANRGDFVPKLEAKCNQFDDILPDVEVCRTVPTTAVRAARARERASERARTHNTQARTKTRGRDNTLESIVLSETAENERVPSWEKYTSSSFILYLYSLPK